MDEVKIIEWEDKYGRDFVNLSIEWLEKYVSVEPGDLEILHHPHEAVLDCGGNIFFANSGDRIVGTVAMIKCDSDTYELAKLAVTEKYKGQKIGNLLIERALRFAREEKARRVILYTNHKLIPAIRLYKKYGFQEIPLVNNKYLESDIKMELYL